MSRKIKPLTKEEVPVDFQSYFNFDTQKVINKSLNIERKCIKCGEVSYISVSLFKNYIKKGYYTCKCQKCYYNNNNLKLKGEKSYKWKGGKIKRKEGYIKVYSPDNPNKSKNGYVMEHRIVMEEKLGRKLLKSETVHHLNGKRDDNRIENLELRVGNHGPNHSYKDLTVKEIQDRIEAYEQELNSRNVYLG